MTAPKLRPGSTSTKTAQTGLNLSEDVVNLDENSPF